MRRCLYTLAIFLVLGAVVNVAVVWGCAMILAEQTNNWNMRSGAARLEDNYVWGVNRLDRPGYFSIESYVVLSVMEWDERLEEPSTLIEKWSRIPDRNDLGGEISTWQESASGWPVASMWSRLIELDPLHNLLVPNKPRVLPRDKLERGWLLDWSFLPTQSILPNGVIWPGFAVNTIFYAAILWLVIPGPFALRRHIRRKRGLCVVCGYDLRGDFSAGCSECGWRREAAS